MAMTEKMDRCLKEWLLQQDHEYSKCNLIKTRLKKLDNSTVVLQLNEQTSDLLTRLSNKYLSVQCDLSTVSY